MLLTRQSSQHEGVDLDGYHHGSYKYVYVYRANGATSRKAPEHSERATNFCWRCTTLWGKGHAAVSDHGGSRCRRSDLQRVAWVEDARTARRTTDSRGAGV